MLHFEPTYKISDVISILLFVSAFVGLYLTLYQIRQSYRIQKATFFKDLSMTLISETNQKEGFYLIINNKFIYDDGFKGSQIEKQVDALLSFLEMICSLYKAGILTKQEMPFFEYAFRKVYANSNIRTYLEYLRKTSEHSGNKTTPFASYISYCQRELGRGGETQC